MLEPMLDEVVPGLGTDFEIPVIFIQGSEDKLVSDLNGSTVLRGYRCSRKGDDSPRKCRHLAILKNRALFRDALLGIKPMLTTNEG